MDLIKFLKEISLLLPLTISFLSGYFYVKSKNEMYFLSIVNLIISVILCLLSILLQVYIVKNIF